MTAERDPSVDTERPDDDATVKIRRPAISPTPPAKEEEDFDPESTLVRDDDDWESTVIRRVAPHIAAVQSEVAEDPVGEDRFGWESVGLKRLAHEVQKVGQD